jgi:ankyrin repeat protein
MKQYLFILFSIRTFSLDGSQMNTSMLPNQKKIDHNLDQAMWDAIEKVRLREFEKLFVGNAIPDVNSMKNGWTALIRTASSRSAFIQAMARLLISYGADVNLSVSSVTPLIASIKSGEPEIAELLIAKGARLNEQDDEGKTALIYAASSPSSDWDFTNRIKPLIVAGADPNIQDDEGYTALMRLIQKNLSRDLDLIEYISGTEGRMIQLLVAAGANPYIQNELDEDKIAIDYAFSERREEVKKAIERGLKDWSQYWENQKLARREIENTLPPVLANIVGEYAYGKSPEDLPTNANNKNVFSRCIIS